VEENQVAISDNISSIKDLATRARALTPACPYCYNLIEIDPRPRNGGGRRKGQEGDQQKFCCDACSLRFWRLSEAAQAIAELAVSPLARLDRLDRGDPEFPESPAQRHQELMSLMKHVQSRRNKVSAQISKARKAKLKQ